MEPKFLPSSMRQPKRYVVFEVVSEHSIEYQDLVSAVWNSTLALLGEASASEARPWFIVNLYNTATQKGVLKCAHNMVEQMRTALSLIAIVGESRSIVRIIGVTGTINAAQEKYLK